jgi:hypothetical protein
VRKALSSCRSSGPEIPVTHYFLKRREWLAMATSSPADKGHCVAMAAQTKSVLVDPRTLSNGPMARNIGICQRLWELAHGIRDDFKRGVANPHHA